MSFKESPPSDLSSEWELHTVISPAVFTAAPQPPGQLSGQSPNHPRASSTEGDGGPPQVLHANHRLRCQSVEKSNESSFPASVVLIGRPHRAFR